MRIGIVIGNLTLSQAQPGLVGARWLLVQPLSLDECRDATTRHDGSEVELNDEKPAAPSEPVVVYDEQGAGVGSMIGISEGREAAQPFYPKRKPVDAYCACILDSLEIADSS